MRTNLLKSFGLIGLMLANANCFESLCDLTECVSDGGGNTGGAPQGGGGEGAAGGDGGGGGLPVGCLPTEGAAIGPECGVFVTAGSTGDGSQASPYGSLAEALENVGDASAIYLCDGIMVSGSVELSPGVSLFGGLTCADWTYSAENPRPLITGTPDSPAVKIVGAGTSTLMSVDITAPDAVEDGASSIALLVSEATVDVVAVDLVAGKGQDGAAGAPQAKVATPVEANGRQGTAACSGGTGVVGGGGGEQEVCQAVNINGGLGGSGTDGTDGGTGNDGRPLGPTGKGGAGELGDPAPDACDSGDTGMPGGAGMPGAGASEDDLGELSSSGFEGAAGMPGMSVGGFGQGGGGGGGANECNGAGHSGGGGGAGGCGGNPGNPGGGGGGSFALITHNAAVSLAEVGLTAGLGGTGGMGDAGQEGMDGGSAGPPGGVEACSGGKGGNGGRGGAGGGGRGGPSVGIAFVGEAPMESGSIEITTSTTPAPGGDGGDGGIDNEGEEGADGITELRQDWN